jgi:hypothetical protein
MRATRIQRALAIGAGVIATLSACGGGDPVDTPAGASAAREQPLASGAGGGGGGGGAAGGGGVVAKQLTFINVPASATVAAGYPMSLQVGATVLGGEIPVLTLNSAPEGFSMGSQVGGAAKGWATSFAPINWTPSRSQIGTAQSANFTATTPAGSIYATINYTVIDRPLPITNLRAVTSADRIVLSWTPTPGAGVDPISYVVTGCYSPATVVRIGGRGGASPVCEQVAATPEATVSVPLFSPTAPAGAISPNYYYVSVYAVDAAGTQGGAVSATPAAP